MKLSQEGIEYIVERYKKVQIGTSLYLIHLISDLLLHVFFMTAVNMFGIKSTRRLFQDEKIDHYYHDIWLVVGCVTMFNFFIIFTKRTIGAYLIEG
jgi:hypothetical protein